MSQSDATQAPPWSLQDAAQIALENPYTFYRPSREAIALLKPSHYVQLIFGITSPAPGGCGGERMWVCITHIDGDHYVGHLNNQPAFISDLIPGARIEFETKHIISVDFPDPVPDPTLPFRARCLVTHAVLEQGHPVGFLARAEPLAEEDSGWRIWSGEESDADLADDDQYAFVSLGAVLRKDDSFVAVLNTPAPCMFARHGHRGRFAPVDLGSWKPRSVLGPASRRSRKR